MTAPAATNILADRSSKAKVTAKLKAGHKVKADFLEAGWYAVFRLDEKDRNKKKALGYVASKSLKPVNQPLPAKANTAGATAVAHQSELPKEIPAGTKFVVDLTVPPQTSASGERTAASPPVPTGENAGAGKTSVGQPPLSEANKAEAKALADQLLPQKANTAEKKVSAEKPPQTKAGTAEEKVPVEKPARQKANTAEEKVPAEKSPQLHAGTAEEKAAAAASAPDSDDEGIVLRDIAFTAGPAGHERVFITLNRQATPVLSSIQNESPRVVADFKNVVSVRSGLQSIPVNGTFVKRIRSSYDPAARILRIVLDLDPSKNYLVNQVLSQKENIYAFDLSEDPENPVR